MARLKAEQLEDFSSSSGNNAGEEEQTEISATTTGGTVGDDLVAGRHRNKQTFSREEVQHGSQLLKDLLKRWKAQTEGLSKEEQIKAMKKLVLEDDGLRNNRYFQMQIAAL